MAKNQVIDEEEKWVDKLNEILEQNNITKVILVDDQVEISGKQEQFIGLIKAVIATGKTEELKKLIKDVDFETHKNIVEKKLRVYWDQILEKKKREILSKLYLILGQKEESKDQENISLLTSLIPNSKGVFLGPQKWLDLHNDLIAELKDDERILVLFDRDLKEAGDKFLTRTGIDLIKGIRTFVEDKKIVCALLTHTIEELSDELVERKRIVTENKKELSNKIFFALSKKRLNEQNLFYDGLKKTLLNGFFEILKEEASELIKGAYIEALEEIDILDTYAFDKIILKSSFKEGVLEIDTLFRLSDIYFKDALKKKIIDEEFLQKINPSIEMARGIGKIDFTLKNVENSKEPYLKPFLLRNNELFERMEILNVLNQPISNGDIFEINYENKTENYVLIGQDCDLMIRNDGNRSERFGRLFKIKTLTRLRFEKEYQKYNSIYRGAPYFQSRFLLDYFSIEPYKVGLVEFKKSLFVDLDVLDLTAINKSGIASYDPHPDNSEDLILPGLKARYKSISKKMKSHGVKIENIKNETSTLPEELRIQLMKNSNPTVFFPENSMRNYYSEGKFNFGIKRIKRLRNPKADLLLRKYTAFISREAEPHNYLRGY